MRWRTAANRQQRGITAMGDRDASGKFKAGNRAGKGNPHAAKVARLRASMLKAVSPADVAAIIRRLVDAAKAGDIAAAKIIFERTLGAPLPADILERIEILERNLHHD